MKTKIFFLWLFVIVCSFGFGQFKSENELRKKANKFFKQNKFIEAYPLFSQLLSIHPKDVNYNYKYGTCAMNVEADKSNALKYLKYSISDKGLGGPVDPTAYYSLSKSLLQNYEFDKVIETLDVYVKKTKPKERKSSSELKIIYDYAKNAKLWFDKYADIRIYKKEKYTLNAFYKQYDLSKMNGKILPKPDEYKSKKDIEKEDFTLVYLEKPPKIIFYSSYGSDNNKNIFYVTITSSGWSKPNKLGKAINTSYDEDYPFLAADRKTLYFSSKGHSSIGGYDIFKIVYDSSMGEWGKLKHLRFPINSTKDDIFYFENPYTRKACFASNRNSEEKKMEVFTVESDYKIKTYPQDVDLLEMVRYQEKFDSPKGEDLLASKDDILPPEYDEEDEIDLFALDTDNGMEQEKEQELKSKIPESLSFAKKKDSSFEREITNINTDEFNKQSLAEDNVKGLDSVEKDSALETASVKGDLSSNETLEDKPKALKEGEVKGELLLAEDNVKGLDSEEKDNVLETASTKGDLLSNETLEDKIKELGEGEAEGEFLLAEDNVKGLDSEEKDSALLVASTKGDLSSNETLEDKLKGLKEGEAEGEVLLAEDNIKGLDSEEKDSALETASTKGDLSSNETLEDKIKELGEGGKEEGEVLLAEDNVKGLDSEEKESALETASTKDDLSSNETLEDKIKELGEGGKEEGEVLLAEDNIKGLDSEEKESALETASTKGDLSSNETLEDKIKELGEGGKEEGEVLLAEDNVKGLDSEEKESALETASVKGDLSSNETLEDKIKELGEDGKEEGEVLLVEENVKGLDSEEKDSALLVASTKGDLSSNEMLEDKIKELGEGGKEEGEVLLAEDNVKGLDSEEKESALETASTKDDLSSNETLEDKIKELGEGGKEEGEVLLAEDNVKGLDSEEKESALETASVKGDLSSNETLEDKPKALKEGEAEGEVLLAEDNIKGLDSIEKDSNLNLEELSDKIEEETENIPEESFIYENKEIEVGEDTEDIIAQNTLDSDDETKKEREFISKSIKFEDKEIKVGEDAEDLITQEKSTKDNKNREFEKQGIKSSSKTKEINAEKNSTNTLNPEEKQIVNNKNNDIYTRNEKKSLKKQTNLSRISPLDKKQIDFDKIYYSTNNINYSFTDNLNEDSSIVEIRTVKKKLISMNDKIAVKEKEITTLPTVDKRRVALAELEEYTDDKLTYQVNLLNALSEANSKQLYYHENIIVNALSGMNDDDKDALLTNLFLDESRIYDKRAKKLLLKANDIADFNVRKRLLEKMIQNQLIALNKQKEAMNILKNSGVSAQEGDYTLPVNYDREGENLNQQILLAKNFANNKDLTIISEATSKSQNEDNTQKVKDNQLTNSQDETSSENSSIIDKLESFNNANLQDDKSAENSFFEGDKKTIPEEKLQGKDRSASSNDNIQGVPNKSDSNKNKSSDSQADLLSLFDEDEIEDNSTTEESQVISTSSDLSNVQKPSVEVQFTVDKNSKKSVYNNQNPIPPHVISNEINYKVQIGAFSKPIPQDLFKGFSPITYQKVGGLNITRYYAGNFVKFNTANDAKKAIQALGYKDAFVVGFKDGIKVSISSLLSKQPVARTESLIEDLNIKSSDIKPNPKIKGLYYTVQIGVFSRQVSVSDLYNINPINIQRTSTGMYKYTSGIFRSFTIADETKKIIQDRGVKDAYVTAYFDGRRITIDQAFKIYESQNPRGEVIENVKKQKEIYTFEVQLGQYKKIIPTGDATKILSLSEKGINNYAKNGYTIYALNNKFKNYNKAVAALQELRDKGLNSAKIVAYDSKGKIVNLETAISK